MNLYLLILYLITIMIFFIGVCLLNSTNTVYTLLSFLVLVLLVSGLLVMLGAELFAIFYILIYIGVIMIFFMFTLMLVNMRFESLKMRSSDEVIVIMTFFHLWFSLIITEAGFTYYNSLEDLSQVPKFELKQPWVDQLVSQLDIEYIGLVMYSKFGVLCFIMGLIFLSVLVGCLTMLDMLKQHEKVRLAAAARDKELKESEQIDLKPPFNV